jgi:Macrocin-O-methyltransferase (TylF)
MLTLFSTPKPFRGHSGIIQRNALQSWKRLHTDAEVILFGNDEGTAEVCRELELRHEPEVLWTEHGTKRLDSIFGRAQEIARHDVLSYVNCDIILTHGFIDALQRLLAWRSRFLMVGCRWDTDVTEPLDFSRPEWQKEIVDHAGRTVVLVLAQRVEDEQILGDVVECSVYKGGTAAILARLATHSRLPRTVWLFDSFPGMPPTAADGPKPPVGSGVLRLTPAGWRASLTVPARASLASASSPASSRTLSPPSTSLKSPFSTLTPTVRFR